MAVKRISISNESNYQELKKDRVIAQGWGDTDWSRLTPDNLQSYIEETNKDKKDPSNAVHYFVKDVRPGDIIVGFAGRTCMGICEIPENLERIHNEKESYGWAGSGSNCIGYVDWVDWSEISDDKICPNFTPSTAGQGVPGVTNYIGDADKVEILWNNYKGKKMIEELKNLLTKVYNLVLTGAPGTGKTHLARQIAEKIVKGNLTNLFNEKSINEKSKSTNTNTINEIIKKWNIYKEKIINKTLTINEYSIAKELNQDNLAYFIKYGSDIYSSQNTGRYSDWGIFKNKDSKYINLNGQIIQEKEAQDTFTKIKNILAKIFSKTSAKDMLQEIQDIRNDDNPLINNWACLRKMVVLCFPREFVPIITDDKLMPPLNLLELSYSKDDFLNNNTQLVKYLRDNIKNDINENDIITWQKVLLDDNTKEKIESFIRTVQFHPSYDYTDFVEGLRPCYVKAKNDKPDQDSKQEIGFELKKGTFLDFCEKAEKDKANKYVFIIDEINRGEISKIFGEIFAAIEPGYRGNTKQKFQTQYANMHNDSEEFKNSPFKDGFYVPDNLYIIGTMNDIDRSVESFDFALRRRFTWMEITAESQAIVMWTANELLSRGFDLDKLQNRMNNLNKKIEEIPGLSKDYHIGPAYFSKLKDYPKDEAYDKLWKNHLEPLLKEYLRGMENIDTNIRSLKEAYNNENEPEKKTIND